MQVKIINPVEFSRWDRQIKKLKGSTIFHTAAWARVLHESYGFCPAYFTIPQNDKVIGCLPIQGIKSFITGRRGISLPFTDICCPLFETNEQFEMAWKKVIDYGKNSKWKHIELRGEHTAYSTEPSSDSYYIHQIDLNYDNVQLMKLLRNSTKRNIKKAERSGVIIHKSDSLESIKAFYRLNCLARKKHGLPPQPIKFFLKLHQYIIAAKMGFVSLGLIQNKVIAAAIFFQFRDKVIYKYGASNYKYQNLRANNLLIWDAIVTAINNGYRQFDFGRTEPGNKGLLQFKRGWATQEHRRKYFRYSLMKNAFTETPPKLKSSYTLFKRFPMPLLKFVGNLLYRHVG